MSDSAVDRLHKHFFANGKPPSTDQVLRAAVLELAESMEWAREHIDELYLLAMKSDDRLDALDKQPKKPRKKYKTRKPRGEKGAAHTAAQARAASSGPPPPDVPPASASRYGMVPNDPVDPMYKGVVPPAAPSSRDGMETPEEQQAASKALNAHHGASLQTRPEHD